MIDILIPNYYRPHHIPRLIENIRKTTRNPYRLTFIIEREDVEAIGMSYMHRPAPSCANFIIGNFQSFGNAINTGYFLTSNEFVFLGVDDIEFSPDWDIEPMRLLSDPAVSVVGHRTIGDGCPEEGLFSCHFTVRRSYVREHSLVALSPNLVMYPYYHHELDRELYWNAMNRGIFKSCPDSVIRHEQAYDEVQKKTVSKDDIDRDTYNNRRHLFRGA